MTGVWAEMPGAEGQESKDEAFGGVERGEWVAGSGEWGESSIAGKERPRAAVGVRAEEDSLHQRRLHRICRERSLKLPRGRSVLVE